MDFTDFSFTFEDNNTGHGDLVLRLAGEVFICDSYYLSLDSEQFPDLNGVEGIRTVLRLLLQQWLTAVETLPDGATAYLLYDFSDQYTACVTVHRTNYVMTLSSGWSDKEGWSISPSDCGDLHQRPVGFRMDGPTVTATREEVLEAIRGMIF